MREQVVVITGASSGLGRAAAIEMARRGHAVVLAARRREALEDTARECRDVGGRAIAVPTDVTIEAEVDRLAATTMAELGRIDAWVNNAGVTLYALLEQGPVEWHQRVIETNLYGALYGARAAVKIFRTQHRGTLVNVGSVLSGVGQAFVPSYVISKFAVHGLSEALRVELADEPDIHVCTLFPYAIDTQHFEVAANQLEQAPYALPPAQSPEKVGRALADLVDRPRRSRYVPRAIALGLVAHAIAPSLTERLLLDTLRRWHLTREPQHTGTGNLYEAPAQPVAAIHGTRQPKLGTLAMIGWIVKRLAQLVLRPRPA